MVLALDEAGLYDHIDDKIEKINSKDVHVESYEYGNFHAKVIDGWWQIEWDEVK